MNYERHAYILAAVDRLHENKSWTGKTHVQKTLALANLLTDLPFAFVLYKHGPYSFDVDEEIEQMRSYRALDVRPAQVGVSVQACEGRRFVEERATKDARVLEAIRRAADFAGSKGVAELEAEATSAWIIAREGLTDPAQVSARLRILKPHIDEGRAAKAAEAASRFLACEAAAV